MSYRYSSHVPFTPSHCAATALLWPGLVLFCLPVGLLTFALWELLARDPVRALVGMPAATPTPRTTGYWTTAALGVIAGAATHILWDGVTHGTTRAHSSAASSCSHGSRVASMPRATSPSSGARHGAGAPCS